MKALILVDIQNDFLPGGALAVKEGDRIIPIVNKLIPHFDHVFATQDWHPKGHISFASTHQKKVGETILVHGEPQVLWPDHCIEHTPGSDFPEHLDVSKVEEFFKKGTNLEIDSYSAFFDHAKERSTGLDASLKKKGIKDLYFVGLATDYCVLYSVLDALELGYHVTLIQDGCKAVNLQPGDEEKAIHKMKERRVKIKMSKDI